MVGTCRSCGVISNRCTQTLPRRNVHVVFFCTSSAARVEHPKLMGLGNACSRCQPSKRRAWECFNMMDFPGPGDLKVYKYNLQPTWREGNAGFDDCCENCCPTFPATHNMFVCRRSSHLVRVMMPEVVFEVKPMFSSKRWIFRSLRFFMNGNLLACVSWQSMPASHWQSN